MPGKYEYSVGLLLISAILTLGYWNQTLIEVSTSKRKAKYSYLKRHSEKGRNPVVTENACGFEWVVNGFDPNFYETKYSRMKRRAEKQQIANNGIRVVPKPVIENPTYSMDPNRYLLPVLEGGPNNQVFCIRETIFIATKLNRTLVIPKFYKHFTDR